MNFGMILPYKIAQLMKSIPGSKQIPNQAKEDSSLKVSFSRHVSAY